jgi:retinol dehydrogenase-12
VRTTLTDSK